MSIPVYFASMLFLFGTPIIIFGMKYFAAAKQARAQAEADQAYRALADKSATAQSANTALLAAIKTDMAALNDRMTAVEKILKAVE